jgi:peptidoglycan/xylan/chitin deacetylase (PgdA/CDA1 family)
METGHGMLRLGAVARTPAPGRRRPACVLTFHRLVEVCEKDHDVTWAAFCGVLDELERAGSSVHAELTVDPATPGDVVVLTFDDGTVDHLRAAETLAARGMAGIFFIPPARMGTRDRLTPRHVQTLQALGHRVGSHGLTDAPIVAGTADVLRRELGESKAILEGWIGAPVAYFAPPGGRLGAYARRALPEFGYVASRSMRWGLYGAHDDRFSIPCIPVTEFTLARGWVRRAVTAHRIAPSMRPATVLRRILPDPVRARVRRMLHTPFVVGDRAR